MCTAYGWRVHFLKKVNSAFIGTQLQDALEKKKISTLVIAGISTDHCVSTSVRMAANLGFKTFVVADATVAFERISFDGTHYTADTIHAVALASLHNEFSIVMNTAEIIKLISEI